MPDLPGDPCDTVRLLHKWGSPATVASAGGRFFGLVVGGSLPSALGARVLSAGWDQIVLNGSTSPVGIQIERLCSRWILEVLGLQAGLSVGFVTGATMANFTCLAAARQRSLERLGWNADRDGLFGAPRPRIVASREIHVTAVKALRLLGFGSERIEWVECDPNGAMRSDKLPKLDASAIVLTQVGNVNSGASDPIGEIVDKSNGAWVHVDGAFGLWAAASRKHRTQLSGYEKADSWTVDGHKWLNTPYDCGMAICRHPAPLHSSMATQAPYLADGVAAPPKDMVPEFSRSARAVEVWAALHALGKQGLEDLIVRNCRHAQTMADSFQRLGFEILNDVCLNQVVATLPGREADCEKIADQVQASGDAWFGTTRWKGRQAIRLSFSSWLTTDADIVQTVAAIERALTPLFVRNRRR